MRARQIPPITLLFFLVSPPSRGSEDKPAVEWIRAHAVSLKTVEAGHGFSDLEPLKKVIADV